MSMLVVTRRVGEDVRIGENIRVTVVWVSENRRKAGIRIVAPREVVIDPSVNGDESAKEAAREKGGR